MQLNGTWKLYYYPCYETQIETVAQLAQANVPCIDAIVPGNVELDLSRAGILPEDLFKGMNILQAEKYEQYDWWYERTFVAPEALADDCEAVLNFRGVDCYADYFLNGEKIGTSDNMFIAHEWDVTDKLKYGQENTIHIHLRSATVQASKFDTEPNQLANSWQLTMESTHSRKAPHSYGWDIMPRAVSAGLWRDVTLDIREVYAFRYLYFATTKLSGNDADVTFLYDSDVPDAYACKKLTCNIRVSCGGSQVTHSFKGRNTGKTVFKIPNAKLWWPKPYGEPNLYDAEVELLNPDGSVLLRGKTRFGVRTLMLHHSEIVEPGGAFEFVANGVRIMASGTNWVPMDAYHSRDAQRYARALAMADDLGCNIIRCWGGNVYEDHAFFDFCDEHGIMVWQDFAMACHYYPQTPEFMQRLEKEAAWVISQYRQHPCIALWSGDNEIDSMVVLFGVDPDTNRLTRETLPRMVERLDPYRSYIASSPYISSRAFQRGDVSQGSKVFPEDHLWGPRDYFKSSFYNGSQAYFVSETGYHGCPARKSIEKFIDAEYVWPYQNNEQWNLHSSDQSNSDHRTMLMHRQVQQLFGSVPTDMDDYILASQVSQAEAKKYFIERMRLRMARNGGVIWWNLIDGWPQMSDAIVDYYYEKKLAYDFIKRSQQPFMITVDELDSWGQNVVCCNSTLSAVHGKCTVYDIDTNEELVNMDFNAAANANTVLCKIPIMYSDQRMLVIRWEVDGKTSFNTYLCGLPGFDFNQYKAWLAKINALQASV